MEFHKNPQYTLSQTLYVLQNNPGQNLETSRMTLWVVARIPVLGRQAQAGPSAVQLAN